MLHVESELFVHGLPVALKTNLRQLRDLVRQRFGLLTCRALRNNSIGKTDIERFPRADRTTRQNHVERTRLPDQPRQADRAAVDQGHTPAAAEDSEHRILLRHAQIAP